MGVYHLRDFWASSLMTMSMGSPVIPGSGWLVHILNPLELNASRSHFSSAGTFSFVGASGIFAGRSGVFVRVMHGVSTPSLQQAVSTDVAAKDVGGFGKDCETAFKSVSASSDKYKPLQFLEM